ncbi:L,D-transpeptidase [Bacillus sp. AK031]
MSLFDSHVKKNLVKLHKNLYISKSDPQYFEKFLRYKDPQSPEAHYHLAKKWEEEGVLAKAYHHYQKAAQTDSPYYFKAKTACKSIEELMKSVDHDHELEVPTKIPFHLKTVIASLVLLNLFILGMVLWKADSMRMMASSLLDWDTGMEVVYESEDIPYVFYFPEDTTPKEVEESLYDRAVSMGNELSNKNVLLYGVMTTDADLSLEVLPLKSAQIKDQAFVIAEYNSTLDQPVRIRFLKNLHASNDAYSHTYISTNLLRTALKAYIDEKGTPPPELASLAGDYPDNYLSFIPKELFLNSNQASPAFSGNGGWVYNKNAETLDEMIYPNIKEKSSNSSVKIPFNPVKVTIAKDSFTLMVESSPYIISKKTVGLGKNDSTPEGTFFVQNRVLQPEGIHKNMFGEAGLGMGEYAIHGTYDTESISKEKSLGCIRLLNEDVQDIFDFVPKGAAVSIVKNTPSETGLPIIANLDVLSPQEKPIINQIANEVFGWAG